MKQKKVLFVFLLWMIFGLKTFSQNINDSISALPKMERAPAFLNLAKSLYSSNFDLADEYSEKALLLATNYGQLMEMGLAHKYLGITDYFRKGYEGAFVHYNEALRIFNEIGNETGQANALNNIAIIYSDRGDFERSIGFYEKSLAIREKQNDAKQIIGSMGNIGNLYYNMGEYDKSMGYYQKGLEISNLVFPEKQFPNLYSSIAKNHEAKGRIGEAGDFYIKAVNAAQKSGNTMNIISNQINIGNFYFDIGSTEKAIDYFNLTLELATEHNMEYNIGVIKLNIGNVYYQTKQYKMAAEFYKSALAITKKTDDVAGQIRGLINVALTNQKLGLMDFAKNGFMEARTLSEKIGIPKYLSMTANYLGKYYLQIQDYDNSGKWLETALDTAKANNILRELYMANYNLGLYWAELKGFEPSVRYFKTALAAAEKMQNVNFQKDASEGLWKSYEELNKYDKAFAAFKTYNILKDSIFNEEKLGQISSVEGKLKLHLKEEQIENQNIIIEQQQQILKQEKRSKIYIIAVAALFISLLLLTLNRKKIKRDKEKAELIKQNLEVERDLLQLQMNPHFIFNAMNSIQAFISMNDSLQAEIFLSKFARLMRYYLDTSSEKWIGLSEEIDALELNLELERLRMNEKFNYKFIIDENIDMEETEIPPMLMQPFVENAIKHGIRSKATKDGIIEIGFSLKEDYIFCYIEDNGVGREAAAKYKSGDPEHISKGVEMTKSRLKPFLSGKEKQDAFKIVDMKDENGLALGTRVELRLPVLYY
ncbi:MAG: hypothetical protein DRJ05_11140 [Bacteroidetes bacterium]|nr:MAG: hypothetical protein DRJ05_11140 [Bacteroidota bacterium]